MVKAYSWHPGADPVAAIWPVPVSLLPDELLSSWIVRVALANGCDPMVLTGSLWPGWRVWTTDVDRGVHPDKLAMLAKHSGITSTMLVTASLQSILSLVATKTYLKNTWPWLLALGARNRKRQGGLQYCPLCLANDKRPYFRIQWRLAWHTICVKHKIYLKDNCDQCGAAIEPHRLTVQNPWLTVCASCGKDLCHTASTMCDNDVASLQLLLDETIIERNYSYKGEVLTTSECFALVAYFIHLIRQSLHRRNSKLWLFFKSAGIDLQTIDASKTGLSFELLSVMERTILLQEVKKIMEFGLPALLVTAKYLGITKSSLLDKKAPEFLIKAFDSLKSKTYVKQKDKRLGRLNPRNRKTVEIMLARLRRRYKALS